VSWRPDSLREATRKAAGECHKLKTRLSRGEKRNRKRMATVATVYSIEGQVRNAEAIMGLKKADETHKPRARNKRVWASVEREPQASAFMPRAVKKQKPGWPNAHCRS
jgi:hypothetical protein